MTDTSPNAGVRPANLDFAANVSTSSTIGGRRNALPDVKLERATCEAEQYEIGIGAWKATIVRHADGRNRIRHRAEVEEVQTKTWARRRTKRLLERLNARRRSAD